MASVPVKVSVREFSTILEGGVGVQSLRVVREFKTSPIAQPPRKDMDINVSFDEQGRVRVLDADKYEQTKQLQDQCSGFSASTFLIVVG